MIFAIVITALALGGVWVYLIPLLQNQIPASLSSNKIAQIAIMGGMILVAVWVVSFVVKSVGVKSIA